MDELFRDYQEKVQGQRESGQVLADVSDYINDDILGMRSWQSVITQILGTLTGVRVPKMDTDVGRWHKTAGNPFISRTPAVLLSAFFELSILKYNSANR